MPAPPLISIGKSMNDARTESSALPRLTTRRVGPAGHSTHVVSPPGRQPHPLGIGAITWFVLISIDPSSVF